MVIAFDAMISLAFVYYAAAAAALLRAVIDDRGVRLQDSLADCANDLEASTVLELDEKEEEVQICQCLLDGEDDHLQGRLFQSSAPF